MRVESAEFVASVSAVEDIPAGGLPEVAFLGASNVGKSTLVNCLLGRKDLANVSKTPGRTQLLNYFRVNDAAHFVDLPGYGFAKVPRSVQDRFLRLVEDYLARSPHLRLLVLLFDSRRLPSARDVEVLTWLRDNQVPRAAVLTKIDKLTQAELSKQARLIPAVLEGGLLSSAPIAFSAPKGRGRRELWKVIDDALAAHGAGAKAPQAAAAGRD